MLCFELGALIFSVVIFFTYNGGWCYGKSYCKETPPVCTESLCAALC